MFSRIKSFALSGIDGYLVDAETDISVGSFEFNIVGLPDNAVKESKERIVSAIKNSQLAFPFERITVNLAPSDTKKEGAGFDLPIALGILKSSGGLKIKDFDYIAIGELSLNGEVRAMSGLLPLLISAKQQGYVNFIIPYENRFEASFVSGINCFAVKRLKEIVGHFESNEPMIKVEHSDFFSAQKSQVFENDFADVKGQEFAKRAMEIAAAGGHNMVMIGAPGSGKSMLAKCFPSILPDLTFDEALQITKIHSVACELDLKKGIVAKRPIRTPHHTASRNSLVGGGTKSKPGEVSLAHNGVLFLDEMPEYPRSLLESLRQPLEDGIITVSRTEKTITYPAQFILIGAMNPCPCGNFGSHKNECRCSVAQIKKYHSRISTPLLDRIDLQIEVDSVEFEDLRSNAKSEYSANIRERVQRARNIQLKRFGGKTNCNSRMTNSQMESFCKLDDECEQLLKDAFERLNLSARGYTRILKVARTIADLCGSEEIKIEHLAESIQYRSLDKKYF